MNENIIEVKDLKKYFKIKKEKDKYVKAIDGISFNIRKGETLGLVGESGSGKSTTAYSIMGLHSITDGSIIFRDNDISMNAKLRKNSIKKEIQIVFQDPGTTLNPKRSIKKILKLPLEVHKIVSSKALNSHIEKLLDMVDLPPYFMYKNPPTLGGGERQLIAIARALATDPSVIVLDEPTSALDVSIQAKIINKLIELQKEFDFSYLFITHDMSLMMLNMTANLGMRTALLIGLPSAIGLFVLAEPIIALFYPALGSSKHTSVGYLLTILAISVIFLTLVQSLTAILQAVEKQKLPVKNLAIGAFVKIVLTYILVGIESLNVAGAAYSTIAAYFTAAVLNYLDLKNKTKIDVKLRNIIPRPFTASIIMGIIVFAGYSVMNPLLGMKLSALVSVALGVAVYIIALPLTKAITKKDLELLPRGEKIERFLIKLKLMK
ncbi:MAG: polysaccharide biosynthesis C-terminal domain-containing protein [Tissierellales bacterium]|nr:polysaccharide biosynthesis C-terminal domain-containing protein [Tissierellales bacterium]